MSETENIEQSLANKEPSKPTCPECGGKLDAKVAAVSYDGKYQIKQVGCDACDVQMWIVNERPSAPKEIDAIV